MQERTILHCDLNNFYASVECKYHPEFRNVPMAVGGDQEARRGVVLAKNQLAKKYGVTTGEPIVKAKQKCPDLVIAPAHRHLYHEYSLKAREIYGRYTDIIEPFGIDECWLDVSGCKDLFGGGISIANNLRKNIKEELELTISVGVSFNKIFAKLGSDLKKPDATSVISHDNFKNIVWPLPAADLLYVGKTTASRLSGTGIFTIGDIAKASPQYLHRMLGKMGDILYKYANGLDDSPVEQGGHEARNRSIGNSTTTQRDLRNNEEAYKLFREIAEEVAARMKNDTEKGYVVQIVIKDSDFKVINRQMKMDNPTNSAAVILEKSYDLFLKNWKWKKNIRMLGITVADLVKGESVEQLSLFDDPGKIEKKEHIEESMDKIKDKYGKDAVKRGF